MSSDLENSSMDFDFDIVDHVLNNSEEKNEDIELQNISCIKKRLITTDSVLKKYRLKSVMLEEAQKFLLTSKEECKQVCINYKNALENCNKWEKDVQLLSIEKHNLQERLQHLENQYEAIQSHANQLQMLVQKYDLKEKESRKKRNGQEKVNLKEQTKSTQNIEYHHLVNDLCLFRDIVLGERKVHKKRQKQLLKKYEKYKPIGDNCTASEFSVDNDLDDFVLSSMPSSDILFKDKTDQPNKFSSTSPSNNLERNMNDAKKVDGGHDSDSGNEIISQDTGRGSSLASSDIEKCFNSPDYYLNDFLFSNTMLKDRKNYTDQATSPIRVQENQFDYQNLNCEIISEDTAFFDLERCLNSSDDAISSFNSTGAVEKEKTNVDRATSPIALQVKQVEIATSPIPLRDCLPNHNIFRNEVFTTDIGITTDLSDFVVRKTMGINTESIKHHTRATSPIAFDSQKSISKNNSFRNEISTKDIGITADLSEFVERKAMGINTESIKHHTRATSPIAFDSQKSISKHNIFRNEISTKDIGITADLSDFVGRKAMGINTESIKHHTRATSPIAFDSQKSISKHNIFRNEISTRDIGITADLSEFVGRKAMGINTESIKHHTRATSPIAFDSQKSISKHNIFRNEISTKDIGITADLSEFVGRKAMGINTESIKHHTRATSPIAFDSQKSISKHIFRNEISTKDIGITADLSDFVGRKAMGINTESIKHRTRATSPIAFGSQKSISKHNIFRNEISTKDIGITADLSDFVGRKTMGINTESIKHQNRATSPIAFGSQKSMSKNLTDQRKCLELNGSVKVNDSHADCEVETILNTMRLDRELITPIPKSPAPCDSCQDSAKVRKENENLQDTLHDIGKYLINMTQLMKNRGVLVDDNFHHNRQDCNDFTPNHSIQPITLCENNQDKNSPIKNVSDSLHMQVNEKEQTIDVDQSKLSETGAKRNPVENMNQSSNVYENDVINKENLLRSPVHTTEKTKKVIKLTRLEKIRKKLIPQCKIRRAMTPPIGKAKAMKRKQLLEKKVLEQSSKTLLNGKTAYEKAVKVMAELRAKEKDKNLKSPGVTTPRNYDFGQKVQIIISKCDDVIAKYVNRSNNALATIDESTAQNDLTPQNHVKTHDVIPINVAAAKTASPVRIENPPSPVAPSITTRSRSKRSSSELSNSSDTISRNESFDALQQNEISKTSDIGRGARKRSTSNQSETTPIKKSRRSNMLSVSCIDDALNNNKVTKSPPPDSGIITTRRRSSRLSSSQKNNSIMTKDTEGDKSPAIISYNDLDIFSESLPKNIAPATSIPEKFNVKQSILCRMLEKYAKESVNFHPKKISDVKITAACQKLQEGIAHVIAAPHNEAKNAMNVLVNEIQNWDRTHFLIGLMRYLKDPVRKNELFFKVNAPPAPLMTKPEQVLIYILKELQTCWSPMNIIESVLSNIEFTLFQLNHTPEFGVVESLAHFYALLCRYYRAKSRLRLFILDAMYCIQFKAVALIKQCFEVWMHVLPLAHMGIAKTPLVMCLIYLLHFFKCDDKFKRVQDIRYILSRKYFYEVTEWTETRMLEMFKNALREIREIPIEKKMLRMSLIILAKRRGPKWTQKNIIKDMLLPLIEKEDVPDRVKEFCVSVLGPLLKPYPNDMKVHSEIIFNQLLEMVKRDVKPSMKEAVVTSLLYMRRQNQMRVNQALLAWSPNRVSPELEALLKDYVKEKPAKLWRTLLSKVPVA